MTRNENVDHEAWAGRQLPVVSGIGLNKGEGLSGSELDDRCCFTRYSWSGTVSLGVYCTFFTLEEL